MKRKVTITLSADLLAKIDRHSRKQCSRSAFIEKVLRDYFRDSKRQLMQERDRKLIDATADYLNEEMEDILRYQAPLV
jgi:metal-responsive CopG/Arc/MetJ family transcriptional regulator